MTTTRRLLLAIAVAVALIAGAALVGYLTEHPFMANSWCQHVTNWNIQLCEVIAPYPKGF
jgi:hypothetical protein